MVICTSANAIIVGDNGNIIQFRKKCPKCGNTDSQVSQYSLSSGRGSLHYSASCSKCGKPWGSFDFERR